MSNIETGRGPWTQTFTGRKFYFTDPRKEDIYIGDIAHALSNICRFNGHTREFMSVAQHSVIVSRIVPPYDAMAGLLHDATEAYIGDVTTPMKILLGQSYRFIEQEIWKVIADKFGLFPELPESVRLADRISLATERRDLMSRDDTPWECLDGINPLPRIITPWDPYGAKRTFLSRFIELTRTPMAYA